MPKATPKPTIGVFFGSRSTEHDVSIVTALAAVIKPLELSGRYNVVPVYIAKDGRWYSHDDLKDISLYASGRIDDWRRRHYPVSIGFEQGLVLYEAGRASGWPANRLKHGQRIDIAFPALHGTHGEDGEVMAAFELAGVPYVGCNVATSAVAMDKVLTKQIVQSEGIAVAKYQHFSKWQFEADADDCITKINRTLRYPLFVKPAHLGSSIGIGRVDQPKDLRNAIEVAVYYDDKFLVEEAVANLIEVTLPIMGNDEPQAALLEQPLVHSEDFFDFETKYMHGGKKGAPLPAAAGTIEADAKDTEELDTSTQAGAQGYSRIPAELPDGLYKKAEETGLRVYRALGCSGMARVDMLIDSQSQTVYCNEVNPLPGSLYAHNWNQAGVSDVSLVERLVELALQRHEQRQSQETVFATNFLQQF